MALKEEYREFSFRCIKIFFQPIEHLHLLPTFLFIYSFFLLSEKNTGFLQKEHFGTCYFTFWPGLCERFGLLKSFHSISNHSQ